MPDAPSNRSFGVRSETAATAAATEEEAEIKGTLPCLRPLFSLVLRPEDSPLERHRKIVVLTTLVVLLVTSALTVAMGALTYKYNFIDYPSAIGWYPIILTTVAAGPAIVFMLRTRSCPPTLIYLVIFFIVGCCVVGDYEALLTLRLERTAHFLVIPIDLLFTMRMSREASYGVLACAVSWALFVESDLTFDWGLLSAPFEGETLYRKDLCDCEDPPCRRIATHVHLTVTHILLFYCNFFFTRRFADQAEEERQKLQAAIDAARAVAAHLGSFNLDAASSLLFPDGEGSSAPSATLSFNGQARLPVDMHATLVTILTNLRGYRPFLPDTLFGADDSTAPIASHSGSGGGGGGGGSSQGGTTRVAIGGTAAAGGTAGRGFDPASRERLAIAHVDIVGGTALWEGVPRGAMRQVMARYSALVRSALAACGGCEVRTIGDAFMVAFEEPCDAVRFGLRLQEALLAATWPSSLLGMPQCERDNAGLWGGLITRVGVGYGPVSTETDPLSGRVDYYGTAVNAAVRVQALAFHGSVALPARLLKDLSADPELAGVASVSMGGRTLPDQDGVDEELVAVYPRSLQKRCFEPGRGADDPAYTFSGGGSGVGCTPGGGPGGVGAPGGGGGTLPPPPPPLVAGSARRGRVVTAASARLRSNGRRAATVASVELQGMSGHAAAEANGAPVPTAVRVERWSSAVARVLTTLERCGGKVTAVSGASVSVSWNTVQGCPAHLDNCFRFVGLLGGAPHQQCAVGCATAEVLYGTLGNATQRFVNVMGEGVVLCKKLADTAAYLRELCLYANLLKGCTQHSRTDLVTLTPCDEWATLERTKYSVCKVYGVSAQRRFNNPLVAQINRFGHAPASASAPRTEGGDDEGDEDLDGYEEWAESERTEEAEEREEEAVSGAEDE